MGGGWVSMGGGWVSMGGCLILFFPRRVSLDSENCMATHHETHGPWLPMYCYMSTSSTASCLQPGWGRALTQGVLPFLCPEVDPRIMPMWPTAKSWWGKGSCTPVDNITHQSCIGFATCQFTPPGLLPMFTVLGSWFLPWPQDFYSCQHHPLLLQKICCS